MRPTSTKWLLKAPPVSPPGPGAVTLSPLTPGKPWGPGIPGGPCSPLGPWKLRKEKEKEGNEWHKAGEHQLHHPNPTQIPQLWGHRAGWGEDKAPAPPS